MRLSAITGQETAKRSLTAALTGGRLAQAYLLHGPEGVGKRSLAQVLVGWLACSRPGPDGACGECPDCRMTVAGTHPDVQRPGDADGSLGIREVRQALAALAYRPRGRRHIVLISPADQLTTQAANALLKTLEEPPGAAVFILTTAHPERLPLTVRSRCIRVPFRRLARDEIRRGLETMGYTGPEAETAAALAEGSLGRALEIMGGGDHLAIRDEMAALARRMHTLRPAEIAVIAHRMGTRAALEARLPALLTWYRDVLLLRETGAPDLLVNADRVDWLREMGARSAAGELARMVRRIDEALGMLRGHGNPRLIAEVLLLGLSGRGFNLGNN